mmetsp:Transcript_29763/g.74868  ORF Transcript_29763/g.74868 Transcript_29763/m.74868 type:complete len:221 (-) Transcript_29763:1782-2444(-)
MERRLVWRRRAPAHGARALCERRSESSCRHRGGFSRPACRSRAIVCAARFRTAASSAAAGRGRTPAKVWRRLVHLVCARCAPCRRVRLLRLQLARSTARRRRPGAGAVNRHLLRGFGPRALRPHLRRRRRPYRVPHVDTAASRDRLKIRLCAGARVLLLVGARSRQDARAFCARIALLRRRGAACEAVPARAHSLLCALRALFQVARVVVSRHAGGCGPR